MWRAILRTAGAYLDRLRRLVSLALFGLRLRAWGRRILEAAAGLVTRAGTAAGPAPSRPRPAPIAHYDHPRVRGMSRRAALFLFEQCGLGLVPAQFWPVLEQTGDPGESLGLFLSALGCDPIEVARGDPAERDKAADVMDLLVRAGDVLSRLSTEARAALADRLQAGDHATVRAAAEVAADLNAALEIERRWQGAPLMAVFTAALAGLQDLAADPLEADPEAVRATADRLQALSDAQARLKASGSSYGVLADALQNEWPEAWDGGPREEELVAATGDFERYHDRLWHDPELSPDDLRDGQERLLLALRALEELLARAQAHNAAASARARQRRADEGRRKSRARTKPRGELEAALVYFGFPAEARPSLEEAKRARAAKFKAVHPDYATDEAERARRHYEIQQAYAHWEVVRRLMDR